MLKWMKNKFSRFYFRFKSIIVKSFRWLFSFLPFKDNEKVDFSSYNAGDKLFHTASFARIYEMTPRRKWQWLRNLTHLNCRPKRNLEEERNILARFLNKEEELIGTDLSFECNPIPLKCGDDYINESAFKEYLGLLAHNRHYHLFAHILMSILKKNSVSTLELLKNLNHACEQLIEQHFFDESYSLLYIKNKSQQWIGSLMYRIMPEAPSAIYNNEVPLSAKNILLCDDICYTGTQAIELLKNLVYHSERSNQEFKITLLFGRMSLYALSALNEEIKHLKEFNSKFKATIVVGQLFHTLSAQLNSLPFPPTIKERHIFKQLLYSSFSESYSSGDFRRVPLLTTAWKKPDFVSSYRDFLGIERNGPDTTGVSSALLSEPPSSPITLFSEKKPAPNLKVREAFISGPQPPYKHQTFYLGSSI